MFEKYKGVKLYDIIRDVGDAHQVTLPMEEVETAYRAEVARLFDQQLQPIPGAKALVEQIKVPMCVVSNGTVKDAALAGLNRHAAAVCGAPLQRL